MRTRRQAVWLGLLLLATAGVVVIVLAGRADDVPVPVPHEAGVPRIRVEVLNGAGRAGLAREATRRLRDHGFDVVFYGNAADFSHDSSAVLARLGDTDAADAVAQALGIATVVDEPDSTRILDVSVILGLDWEVAPEPEPRTRTDKLWDALRGRRDAH